MTWDNWAFLALGATAGLGLALLVWVVDGWAARRHHAAVLDAVASPAEVDREVTEARAPGADSAPVVGPGEPCPPGPHFHGAEIRRAQLTPQEALGLARFFAAVQNRDVQIERAGDETAQEAEAFLSEVRAKREDRKSRPYDVDEDGGL